MAPRIAPPPAPIAVPDSARCWVSFMPEQPARTHAQTTGAIIVFITLLRIGLSPPPARILLRQERSDPVLRRNGELIRIGLAPLHEARQCLVPRRHRLGHAEHVTLARTFILFQHAIDADAEAMTEIQRRGAHRIGWRGCAEFDQITGRADHERILGDGRTAWDAIG